jgi:TPR repeat protein
MPRLLLAVLIVAFCNAATGKDIDLAIAGYASGDYKHAAIAFEKLAHQADAGAQFYLGLMYRNGDGVAQDNKQALYWFTQAANQGDAAAQFNPGMMYRNGEVVPRDYVQTHFWWSLAGAQGGMNAAPNMDATEELMSREQIAQAQRLTREWEAQ